MAGFDNSIYAQVCSPPLTTVAVDIEEKSVKLAARRMIKHMSNPAKKGGVYSEFPAILYTGSLFVI